SEHHGARFLLLLNSDKLADKETWATLHEKVIDAEIILDPSPAEAFDIAASQYKGPFRQEIKETILALEVNNIRVIRRILSTMIPITAKVTFDPKVPATRTIPSIVLLTAIHFRGLRSAIALEYVRTFNTTLEHYVPKKDKDPEK